MTPQILLHNQLQVLLLSFVPGLPLVVALSLLVPSLKKTGLKLAPWSALPALAAALFLKPGINLEVTWFFMGGRMGLDLVGRHFLLLAALVWLLSAFFGQGYLGHDHRRYHFFFFYLLSMAFNFGLILAQDMLGFYLFFALMSFSAYGLIVHARNKEARQAGIVYITLVMVGEVLLFAGMLLMAGHLPDLELSTVARSRPDTFSLVLLLLGFAIKAGALPLHVWLPLAHPVAPVPASAVLSGVMIKAGLLGWLRFLPISLEMALPGWGFVFVVLGFLAVFYGVVVGLGQQDVKTVLAYSSISQMGLMTTIIGCGLLAPHLWVPITGTVCLYALHHGLAKASLFLGAGVAKIWPSSRSSLWLVALLLLPCLALAGFPMTSGAITKFAVKEMSHGLPPLWIKLFDTILPLSALATTALLYHFLECIMQSSGRGRATAFRRIIGPWLVSVIAVGGLLWALPMGRRYGASLLELDVLWQGLWPVALGCGLMAMRHRIFGVPKSFVIPAGDILWYFYGWSPAITKFLGKRLGKEALEEADADIRPPVWTQDIVDRGRQVEKKLTRWAVVGFSYLLLCFVLLILVVTG